MSWCFDGGKMGLQHGREAGLCRRQHALAAAAFGQHYAGTIDQPEPEAAGAPVHRDVSGFGHLGSRPRLTGKTPSRDNETTARKFATGYRLLPPQTSVFSRD
ncbi:hypothetical protein ACVWZV_003058 [Bradyrhizobium sp. GM5.1]